MIKNDSYQNEFFKKLPGPSVYLFSGMDMLSRFDLQKWSGDQNGQNVKVFLGHMNVRFVFSVELSINLVEINLVGALGDALTSSKLRPKV